MQKLFRNATWSKPKPGRLGAQPGGSGWLIALDGSELWARAQFKAYNRTNSTSRSFWVKHNQVIFF